MRKLSKFRFIAVAAVIVSVIAVSIKAFNFNDTEYTVTVTDKERITESENDSHGNVETSSKYLVFADDENGNSLVFENTDCFIRSKFNSSNVQGQLKEGHTYKITVIGYRVPFSVGIRILSGLRNYKLTDEWEVPDGKLY